MKRFRPYCTGYIVLYVLTLLCLGDSVYTVISQLRGSNNPMISSFSMFSYIILALALGYTYMYIRAQVAIDDRSLRVAWPAYIQPREGEKRALFLYRQGNLDIKFIDKTIPLRRIVRYGFVEDLGYQPVDRTDPQGKVKFFPVHEVAMMMSIALRFIPILMDETDKIIRAQEARGADFDTGGIIKKAKALVPLLVPLFVAAFRRANDLAMAMEARGYHGGEGRTKMKPLVYKTRDYVSYLLFVLYLVVMFLTRKYIKIDFPL